MELWESCLQHLHNQMPESEFAIWMKPLKIVEQGNLYTVYCPHKFFLDWVRSKYQQKIVDSLQTVKQKKDIIVEFSVGQPKEIMVGNTHSQPQIKPTVGSQNDFFSAPKVVIDEPTKDDEPNLDSIQSEFLPSSMELTGFDEALLLPKTTQHAHFGSILKKDYSFDNFVTGKANEIARASALQTSINPGTFSNPLFIYGGSGLGKTHLMHAIGNNVLENNPDAKVLYVTSERYIKDYVDAIRLQSIDEFQSYYRSVDVLLVDDIQFIAGKQGTQEEFFHTFNALFEQGKQVVLTCDKYPNEIPKLEERLASRFSFGLTVTIDLPDLETRTAILLKKAEQSNYTISQAVALYIAQNIRSNVRELEGALKRVINHARFNHRAIDEKLVRECLGDVISIQDRIIKVDNIQQVVANYYNIKITDLLSKQKTRDVAQPRQIAMALARELTTHSLPEIGSWFGGRDHTTVMHAVKTVKKLRETNSKIRDDYQNIIRKLSR